MVLADGNILPANKCGGSCLDTFYQNIRELRIKYAKIYNSDIFWS
jgi:hypothetical protein